MTGWYSGGQKATCLQGQGDAALIARGPRGQPAREVKSTLEPAVCYKNLDEHTGQTIC